MGYMPRILIAGILFLALFFMYPVNGDTDFNINITPANIDFGTVVPNSDLFANYSISNQGSNPVTIQISILQDQNIQISYPEKITLEAGKESEVIFELQVPETAGKYQVHIKFRPFRENGGSGGGAVPEFQGSIKFTVEGIATTMFQVNSGSPETPLLAFFKIDAFNLTLYDIQGSLEINLEGNQIQDHPISINGGDNTTQFNWSKVLMFDKMGSYIARLQLNVNSSRGSIGITETRTFIVGRAIPWIAIKVIEINDEGSKALEISANNNGTLPYLLSLKISVSDANSGETSIVRSVSDIIESPTSFMIPMIVQASGLYVAKIEGIAGETIIQETIQLGKISKINIGTGKSFDFNYYFIIAGVFIVALSMFGFLKKFTAKNFRFPIFAIHIFTSSGEGLLTYDFASKEIQEMDFDRLGRVVMTINSIEMKDEKFVVVKVNETQKMLVTLIHGLGFAVEVPKGLKIENVEKKSNILRALKRIEKERGDTLRNGLVDISADYMEFCMGSI